jgi:tetraacyldisaccharide 4'-kinase
MMRAPDFWTTGAGPWPYLLTPAGWIYGAVGAIERTLTRPHKTGLRVICIGNLTAGGTGKTPVAIRLSRLLAAKGATPGFLSRGYGGSASGPLKVDPSRIDAAAVGDEALLLAQAAPTWIANKRRTAIPDITREGVDHIIMDDGFQDPALAKDISLLVVDSETGFGNGRCIPAGPLREPLATGLARAEGVVLMGDDRARTAEQITAQAPDLPVFAARLVPGGDAARFKDRRVFAFAGIGRPEKFRATLEELGADIQGFRPFPDHHSYGADEITRLLGDAKAADAMAVTTAKDWVRLPKAVREQVEMVEVEAVFADEAGLMALILPPSSPSDRPEAQGQGA